MPLSLRRCALMACLLAVAVSASRAQTPREAREATVSEIAQVTDFSIPTAPAFTLLDVTPALVRTPHFPRDFRLDWVLNDDGLVSDLALSVAPIWMLGYSRKSAADYANDGWLAHTLSTLNLSAATAETDEQRRLAFGAALNLFREADPLRDTSYVGRLERAIEFTDLERTTLLKLANIGRKVQAEQNSIALSDSTDKIIAFMVEERAEYTEAPTYKALSEGERTVLRPYLDEAKAFMPTISLVNDEQIRALKAIQQAYEHENWNSTRIDVGGGAAFTYDSPGLDSLRLDTSGYGLWLNGATGLGTRHVLVSALGRGILQGEDWNWFAGLNFRFGRNEDFNLFVEYVHEWLPSGDLNTISYGGALRLSEQILVQFGLRTSYNNEFEPERLFPVIKLNGRAIPSLSSLF